MQFDNLSKDIIGCAIEVHKQLGPGLLESTYENCLAQELRLNNINCKTQVALPVFYKGLNIDCGYRIDMIIEDRFVMEFKSVSEIIGIHEAQILTYMKLAKMNNGMLINFNVKLLKDGLKTYFFNK